MEGNKTKKQLKEALQNLKLVTPEDQNLRQLCKTLIDEHEELRRNWEIEKTLRLKVEEDLAKKEKLADERLAELIKARSEEVKWKNKFYEIKTAAVVRSEIEKYRAYLPPGFEFNNDVLSSKKTEEDKEEERWRQIWEALLLNSKHDFVVSLRKTFFIYLLEKNDSLQFESSSIGRYKSKEYNSLLKEFVEESYDGMPDRVVIKKKMEFLSDHKNISNLHAGFEKAFTDGPTSEWLQEIFRQIATRIANLHKVVIQTMSFHFPIFEAGEAIPIDYKFSTDIRHQACIEALLVNHV